MLAPPYILQRSGACCVLVALCNARIFLGEDAPRPGTEEFRELSQVFRGIYGSALDWTGITKSLGLVINPCPDPDPPWPRIWEVLNPENSGAAHHLCLATSPTTVVNYRWVAGPVVEDVSILPRRSWIVALQAQ